MGKIALICEVVEAAAEEKVVAVVEEQRLTIGQTLGPRRAVMAAPSVAAGSAIIRASGQYALDFGVDGEVADVLFQHHKVRSAQSTYFSMRAAQ